MFLSFIVPVYNVEKYVAETLDSLLDQDIPQGDYEIVCVNDGSPDGSLAILREYEAKYANIRVIDKENGGVASARNAGLDAAQGDYIWFFDSDDLVLRNFLGTLRSHIAETDADRVKVGTYIFREVLTDSEIEALEKGELKVNSHFYDSSSVTCVLRRSFLQRYNCRFNYPELTHGEDTMFMYETVIHDPVCTELDVPIYFYRMRTGSATHDASSKAHYNRLTSSIVGAGIFERYYKQGNVPMEKTANMLMDFLWGAMFGIADMPLKEMVRHLKKMHKMGLFPYTRPAECTQKKSYRTARTDWIGRWFEWSYLNSHRWFGFCSMVIVQRSIKLKHSIKRRLAR